MKKNELTRTRHGGPFISQNMGGGDRRLEVQGHSCLRSKLLVLLYLYLPQSFASLLPFLGSDSHDRILLTCFPPDLISF